MRSFLMLVEGAFVGAAVTFFVAGGVLTGIGAGAGIATSLQAGACLTAEAAKEKGYITANQVGELLAEAGAQIAGQTPTQRTSFAGSNEDCAKSLPTSKPPRVESPNRGEGFVGFRHGQNSDPNDHSDLSLGSPPSDYASVVSAH